MLPRIRQRLLIGNLSSALCNSFAAEIHKDQAEDIDIIEITRLCKLYKPLKHSFCPSALFFRLLNAVHMKDAQKAHSKEIYLDQIIRATFKKKQNGGLGSLLGRWSSTNLRRSECAKELSFLIREDIKCMDCG